MNKFLYNRAIDFVVFVISSLLAVMCVEVYKSGGYGGVFTMILVFVIMFRVDNYLNIKKDRKRGEG